MGNIAPGAAVRIVLLDGTLIVGELVDLVTRVEEYNAAVSDRRLDHQPGAVLPTIATPVAANWRVALSDVVLVNATGNRYTVAAETIRELKITPKEESPK